MAGLQEFALDWAHHRSETLKLLSALDDASLATRVDAQGGRTLGRIAWHLAQTLPEMLGMAGIHIAGPAADEPTPASAAAIVAAYDKASAQVAPAVQAAWADADLAGTIPMYGQEWPRRLVLSGLMYHESHHRGQMTVLMRQAGLKVPGIFGPAREEWAAYGMPTQD
jgi:uncharacterized damage-inducible protein DinB